MFRECVEAGTLLYGRPGTMDYLKALSISDQGEMNVRAPEGAKSSALLVGTMGLLALRKVGSRRNAMRTALHMARRSYACPTALGRASFRARVDDSLVSFANELMLIGLYRHIGERLAASGRQFDMERDAGTRKLCEDLVARVS